MALASILRIVTKEGAGAHDLQSYWYPGHFIWQRYDPYRAFLERRQPDLPIRYLDGVIVTEGPINKFALEGTAPGYTAPVVLLLAPLAHLSWSTAVILWTMINLSLIVIVAWSVVTILQHSLVSQHGVLLLGILCSLIATREALEYGQPSILILACMLLALVMARQHQIVAGIFLGVAMSKYSLAFPVLLLFAYRKWFKGLAVCILLQLLAAFTVATIGHTTVPAIFASYYKLLLLHANQHGYHLTAGLLSGWGLLAYALILIGSGALAAILWYWHHRKLKNQQVPDYVVDVALMTIFMQYNLLVFYHRRYDHMADILFIAMTVLAIEHFSLSSRERYFVYVFTVLVSVMWIMPIYTITGQLWYTWMFNISNIAVLIVTVWLLVKTQAVTLTVPATS